MEKSKKKEPMVKTLEELRVKHKKRSNDLNHCSYSEDILMQQSNSKGGPIIGGQVTPIPGTLTNSVENLEKKKIIEALKKCGSIKSRSAKLLGITARQLDYKIKINKYEIEIEKF